jgi:hypothetical protein
VTGWNSSLKQSSLQLPVVLDWPWRCEAVQQIVSCILQDNAALFRLVGQARHVNYEDKHAVKSVFSFVKLRLVAVPGCLASQHFIVLAYLLPKARSALPLGVATGRCLTNAQGRLHACTVLQFPNGCTR